MRKTVLSVLEELLNVLKEIKSEIYGKSQAPADIGRQIIGNLCSFKWPSQLFVYKGLPEDMTFEQLRFASDRMVKLCDGTFLDRYLSAYFKGFFVWSPVGSEKHTNWNEAEKYAKSFGRQPSRFELESLIDVTKHDPALVPGALVLELKTDDWHWTNEEVAGSPGYARLVSLEHGGVYGYGKGLSNYVRCVRLSQ